MARLGLYSSGLTAGASRIAAPGKRSIGHGVALVRRPAEHRLLENRLAVDGVGEAPAERSVPEHRVSPVQRDEVDQGLGVTADLDLGVGREGRDLISRHVGREADLALRQGPDQGAGMAVSDLSDSPDLGRRRRRTAGGVGAQLQLDRAIGRGDAAKQPVGHQQPLLLERGHAAVDPGMSRTDRPFEPGAQLDQGPIEPDLDASLVGRLDPVHQVGPPRLELERVGIAPVDECPGHIHGRDLPRPIGPGDPRAKAKDQPPAQVGGLEGRRELARDLALLRLVAVGREDGPEEEAGQACIRR